MRAEWHVSLHDALFVEPIAATLALWPALLSRHGCEEQGDSYVDRQRRKAKARAIRWLDANYTVLKG